MMASKLLVTVLTWLRGLYHDLYNYTDMPSVELKKSPQVTALHCRQTPPYLALHVVKVTHLHFTIAQLIKQPVLR